MTHDASSSSVSAAAPRPARPRAHPMINAPPVRNQAWNHSTALAVNGLATTVKSVHAW